MQKLRSPVTDPVFSFFSILGNLGFVWIAIALILLFRRKTRFDGVQLALCLIFSLIINNLIFKNLVARPRPFDSVDGLSVLLTRFADAGSWSFPSGHAGSSFAAAFSLSKSFKRRGSLAYILAALISFSRMYIGVHFPTDIICGALFGTIGAVIAYFIMWRVPVLYRLKKR